MRGGEVLDRGDQAAVQPAPLARHLVQVVALLPALQAVRFGGVRLGRARRPARRARRRGCRRTTASQPGRWSSSWPRGSESPVVQQRIGDDRRAPGGDQRRRRRPEVLGQHPSCRPPMPRPATFSSSRILDRPLWQRARRHRTRRAERLELRAEQRSEVLEQLFVQRPRLPLGQRRCGANARGRRRRSPTCSSGEVARRRC